MFLFVFLDYVYFFIVLEKLNKLIWNVNHEDFFSFI